jgi:hypothetical protein
VPKILAITQAMHGKARDINSKAMELKASQDNITQVVQGMTSHFDGKIPRLMAQQLVDLKKKYQSMHEKLTEYTGKIDLAADTYDWKDQEIAGWAAAGVTDGALSSGPQPTPGGGTGGGVLDVAKKYIEKSNPKGDEECKGFVRYVFQETFGTNIPSTTNGGREWANNGGVDFDQISQLFSGGKPSSDQINSFFKNLQQGDAVQLYWKDWPHTMIIDSINMDSGGNLVGFTVIDANYGLDNIVHSRSYTLESFVNEFSNSGSQQGMTAYRYNKG